MSLALKGHATKPITEETRGLSSEAIQEAWQNPKTKQHLIEGAKKRWQNPSYRTKKIASIKARWQNNTENRIKMTKKRDSKLYD